MGWQTSPHFGKVVIYKIAAIHGQQAWGHFAANGGEAYCRWCYSKAEKSRVIWWAAQSQKKNKQT